MRYNLQLFFINIFQAEDDEDEQMDQDEEPQMQVVLHEVQFLELKKIVWQEIMVYSMPLGWNGQKTSVRDSSYSDVWFQPFWWWYCVECLLKLLRGVGLVQWWKRMPPTNIVCLGLNPGPGVISWLSNLLLSLDHQKENVEFSIFIWSKQKYVRKWMAYTVYVHVSKVWLHAPLHEFDQY